MRGQEYRRFGFCMKVGNHVLQEGCLCLYEGGNYVAGEMLVVIRMWKVVYYRSDFCV